MLFVYRVRLQKAVFCIMLWKNCKFCSEWVCSLHPIYFVHVDMYCSAIKRLVNVTTPCSVLHRHSSTIINEIAKFIVLF